MKKFVSILLIFAIILSVCSCGKDSAVIEVENKISSIGEVDLNSGEKLHEISLYYEALTESQKNQVENHFDLVKAIDTYNSIVKASQVISGVSKSVYEEGVAILDDIIDISTDTEVTKYIDIPLKEALAELQGVLKMSLELNSNPSSEERKFKELVDLLCIGYIEADWHYLVFLYSGNQDLVELVAISIDEKNEYKGIIQRIKDGSVTNVSDMDKEISKIEKIRDSY